MHHINPTLAGVCYSTGLCVSVPICKCSFWTTIGCLNLSSCVCDIVAVICQRWRLAILYMAPLDWKFKILSFDILHVYIVIRAWPTDWKINVTWPAHWQSNASFQNSMRQWPITDKNPIHWVMLCVVLVHYVRHSFSI